MRKWIVEKLFDLALFIDGDRATILAHVLVAADDFSRAIVGLHPFGGAPKKRGHPKGARDVVKRKRVTRKVSDHGSVG